MMRSANALAQGRIIAEQRRGFYRIIQSWSTADLQASAIRYRMEALAHRDAARFYMTRVRCLNHEMRARGTRRAMRVAR